MRIATNTTNTTSPTSISGSSSSSSTSSSSSSSSSGGSEAIGFSSSNGHTPEWFMLPQAVDVNNDVMRLVSSLSTVVQILTRMTNAAAQELRQHPEREEGFQGLRLLLNYADQMYTTLLQPQPFSSERPASPNRSVTAQPYSLFHHLFEPMLGNMEREEEVSVRQLQPAAGRSFPYRVVAVAASAAVSASGPESNGSIAPTSEFGANVNQIRN
ncbi:uncharacterized protein [Drosophila virilis]|nr:uncharacterized protein LOC6628828 isoform X2 [Drosophila virilis]KRF81513.1 uncharacterized protein Dvir_GJ23642, isoform B [Drosophila virilis]